MTNWFLQMVGFSFCAERDPQFGGHPESRKKSFKFANKFMRDHLFN
jgi:hypothetical protein